MNELNELAEVIRYGRGEDASVRPCECDRAVAEAVIAAGYRKTRTITTVEELDALPFETVIRDGDDSVLERWGQEQEHGWVTVMVTAFIPTDQIALPAVVIWEPKP